MKFFVYYPRGGEGGNANGEGGFFFVSFDGSPPLYSASQRDAGLHSISGWAALEFADDAGMQWNDGDSDATGGDVEFRDLLISQGRFWDSFGYG